MSFGANIVSQPVWTLMINIGNNSLFFKSFGFNSLLFLIMVPVLEGQLPSPLEYLTFKPYHL